MKVSDTIKLNEQRYEIGIPWRENEPSFTNNYDIAFVRLKSQEKSLRRKDDEIMEAYNQIFIKYEEKGYIKAVPKSARTDQWMFPHFPVLRPDKETTRVRAVFDAAMKHDGKSLNDAILPGPKLQREIVDVLIRFRRAPIVLSA